MVKSIPGVIPSKIKLLSPIFSYLVDMGRGKPQVVEANRVDQVGDSLIFMIEYSDYNVFVAGFSKWKSYRLKPMGDEGKKILKKALKKRSSSASL